MLESSVSPQQEFYRPASPEARQSFRVSCLLPVWFRQVPGEEWPEAMRLGRHCPEAVLARPWVHFDRHDQHAAGLTRKGEILNLSASGLLLLAKTKLAVGEGVECALQLPALPQPLGPILARVIWAETRNTYRCGMQFINLPEIYREQLTGFVFKQQRQLRRQQTFV